MLVRYYLKGAPCTPRSVANTLIILAETYKMPDNIVKAVIHLSEVAQQIDSCCQGCMNVLAVPGY
jgi:serine/threonine protein phosphatase PrpC